ncbi:MAG: nucleoside monophosphate kinase [Luteolibacter sp.]
MSPQPSKPFRMTLLGPPASGKGTQGRSLADRLGLDYLSTGALLREHVENRTALGVEAEPILARGQYLPDELMFPILTDWLSRQTGGWVLDGFPRSVPQARFLAEWLENQGQALDAAIALEVPFEVLLKRMQGRVECPDCRWTGQTSQLAEERACPRCGATAQRRSDDEEANFRSRYLEFQNLTLPVIDFYRNQGNLLVCDANAPQDDVTRSLVDHFTQSLPA